MRRVLVDGLVVVADDLGLREGLVPPVHALVLELLLVGGLVVGPVEDHAGLAGVDGAVGHVDGGQVAGLLELLEEVKAGLQVVDVATGELVGHQVAVEGGASLGGLAVEGHGASELRVELGDLDLRVLLLEALDDLAVVGPVVRKGDDVQRALFLGGLLEVFHGAEVGEGGGFGGLFVHGDGLAGAFAGAIGGGVARAAGGHREREHGGEGAGRDLTQVVHNVPFLNIIQTTVWGVGLGMRGIRAAREFEKRNYAPNLS